MASLGLDNQEIKENFAMVAGISRDDSVWDTDTVSDFERVLRAGRRKFFLSHQWRFLEQDYKLVTTAPQTSSTVTVVNGVVTLAAGTFPGDATSGPREYLLSVANGLHEIASWDSTTQLTLRDTTVNAAALSSYSLYRFMYPITFSGNAAFGGFIQPVFLEGENRALPNTGVMPNHVVGRLLRKTGTTAGKPQAYAIAQVVAEDSGIPAHYFMMSPPPDAVYVLNSRLRIQPEDTYDFADSTASFHPVFSECLMAAILASTELYYHNQSSIHSANFQQLLPLCIQKDREMRGAKTLLSRRRHGRDPNYELKVGRGTYDGVD